LTRVIGGRPLGLDSLLSISLQVADALATAHARGIVHRDIKPGNIIITPRGQAKVLDFGLAKLITEKSQAGGAGFVDAELTRMGALLGTPSYMSPEQARGERIDHRSDVFSFGVILYEMATGRGPFKRKSPAETMNAVINEPHSPVIELNANLPPQLATIIDRALAKKPGDRYQAMQQLLEDLRVVAQAHWSTATIPAGVSVPYVRPQRKSSLRGVGRWIGRLFGRETSSGAPRSQVPIPGQGASSSETIREPITKTRTGPSIAVLPFVNLSPDPENEYFCDGLAEELIDALTKMEALRVVSRSASFQFKGEAHDIRQIGEHLNVNHVLEGSVRKAGNRLRITAQLISVDEGYHLWSEKYDRELEDVFAIQDEITEKIVDQLKVKLVGEESVPRVKPATQNVEAYTLYLKGRFYWNKRTEEGIRKGIEYFQQAIELDPDYAVAYAGMADCYSVLGLTGAEPPNECFSKAREAATKAMEIDDTLAEAHASLALVRTFYEWDWSGAEREFQRAIELNPKYPTAHQWYAEYLAAMGRSDEALTEIRRALELDPLALMVITAVGIIFFYAHEYDRAIEPLQRALDMDPTFPPAHRVLGWVYEQKAMPEETIEAYQQAVTFSGRNVSMLADLGRYYGVLGQRDEAQQLFAELRELSKQRYVSPYEIALVYAGMGEKEQAFACLKAACEERYWLMVNLNVHPVWDSLRSEPRFTELLKTMGLESGKKL
jgi:serine/threonine-protein kinase